MPAQGLSVFKCFQVKRAQSVYAQGSRARQFCEPHNSRHKTLTRLMLPNPNTYKNPTQ